MSVFNFAQLEAAAELDGYVILTLVMWPCLQQRHVSFRELNTWLELNDRRRGLKDKRQIKNRNHSFQLTYNVS